MNFHPMPVQCTCHDHTTACHRVISCIKPQLEGMPILQGNSIKTQEYLFAIKSCYMIRGNQTLINILERDQVENSAIEYFINLNDSSYKA